MPSRPPSPRGRASVSRCTSVTRPSAVTDRIRVVSRSVTSALPSGRNARPHGAHRPVAIGRTAEAGRSTSGASPADGGATSWCGPRSQPPVEPPNHPSDLPTPATAMATTTMPTPAIRTRLPRMPELYIQRVGLSNGSGDGQGLQDDRLVDEVVQLVGLGHPRRRDDVDRLGHRARVDGAVRVG